jgi:EthD domain
MAATASAPEREGGVEIAWMATTIRRASVENTLFETYWQDLHGPSVAPLPGPRFYYQHRLGPDHGDFWPALPGITTDLPDEWQLDGMAQLGFPSEEDVKTFKRASVEARIPEDEQNFFTLVAVQSSFAGHHKTFSDALPDPGSPHQPSCQRVFLGLRVAEGSTREAFGARLMEELGPAFAAHPIPQRVRVVLCEDVEDHEAINVEVDIPLEFQYQAWIELAFASRFDLRRFYDDPGFHAAVEGLSEHVGHINAFPVESTTHCRSDGVPTLAGRLGRIRARAVVEIGAVNWLAAE